MIPVRKTDVVLGKPLPYSLFDGSSTLLLREGGVVQSQDQLDALGERGLYRRRPRASAPAPDEAPVADPRSKLLALDDIRLQVGDILQLQGDGEGRTRHAVRLLGYARGRSVMVAAPMVDGAYALVRQDASFVVRCFSGRSVYAFQAHVLKSASTPFPYLHLSYPKQVRGMQVRDAQRADIRIVASVTDPHGAARAATLLDISKGGARLGARSDLGQTGDEIRCKFRLRFDDIDQLVDLKAVLRSVSDAGGLADDAATTHYGIEFTDVQETDRLALTAFVYQRLIGPAGGD
jgi:c-di-GMP-binding flagellar brake protein YcgR